MQRTEKPIPEGSFKNPTQQDLAKAAQEVAPEQCIKCGNRYFQPAQTIKLISALRLGTVANVIYNEGVLICTECRHPWRLNEREERKE